jgi:hypothetical protein
MVRHGPTRSGVVVYRQTESRTIRKEPTMSETTYLPEVQCEVSEGLTESDVTVCVRDVDGREQFIHVLPSMVNWVSETPYLPVGVINVDYRNSRVLIELPIEADSGANRMWMPIGSFRVDSGVPA